MKTIKLQNEEDLIELLAHNWNDNDDSLLPPMFHGTDVSLVGISKTEREQINNACEVIINACAKLYEDNSISLYNMDQRLFESRDRYGNSAWAYRFAKKRAQKSSLYSYGGFYVSNDPKRAIGYSREAWILGETGWTANRLVEGTKAIGLDLPNDDTFKKAFDIFKKRKQGSKAPVVLMVVNCSSSVLFMEDGEQYSDVYDSPEEFAKEIQSIKNHMFVTDSYRLGFQDIIESLQFFLIEQENYPDLLNAWNRYRKLRERY